MKGIESYVVAQHLDDSSLFEVTVVESLSNA